MAESYVLGVGACGWLCLLYSVDIQVVWEEYHPWDFRSLNLTFNTKRTFMIVSDNSFTERHKNDWNLLLRSPSILWWSYLKSHCLTFGQEYLPWTCFGFLDSEYHSVIKHNIYFIYCYTCGYFACMVHEETNRETRISWDWNCRQLRELSNRCWELNPGLLEEQPVF